MKKIIMFLLILNLGSTVFAEDVYEYEKKDETTMIITKTTTIIEIKMFEATISQLNFDKQELIEWKEDMTEPINKEIAVLDDHIAEALKLGIIDIKERIGEK